MSAHAPGVVQALQENGVAKLVAMKQNITFWLNYEIIRVFSTCEYVLIHRDANFNVKYSLK
jgi:hypothetical protein